MKERVSFLLKVVLTVGIIFSVGVMYYKFIVLKDFDVITSEKGPQNDLP